MTPGISWANFYERFIDLLHSDLSTRACDPWLCLSQTSLPTPTFYHMYLISVLCLPSAIVWSIWEYKFNHKNGGPGCVYYMNVQLSEDEVTSKWLTAFH